MSRIKVGSLQQILVHFLVISQRGLGVNILHVIHCLCMVLAPLILILKCQLLFIFNLELVPQLIELIVTYYLHFVLY